MTYTITLPPSVIYAYFAVTLIAGIAVLLIVAREARAWLKDGGSIVVVPRIPDTVEK